MNGIDLEKALKETKKKDLAKNPDQVLEAFQKILSEDDAKDDQVLANIFSSQGQISKLKATQLEADRIYTLAQIKELCTNYRLRFLSTQYFKGTIPHEAVSKIKTLQRSEKKEIKDFKIIAPASLFHLEYKDKDPLLFIPLGNQRYYLVHKWGNDLHPLRKIMVYPFRNFKALLSSVAMLAALIVCCVPSSVMMGPYDKSSFAIRVIFFFYLFIAFSGFTALYGFSRMKNFNSELWNSRYKD
jgi:Ni,Fe-hydrogenase III component G